MTIDVTAGATLSAQVAEEIRALMARRQIRQSQLARRIDVGEQWLSVRLRGKQPIDLNDLALIAGGLGVKPRDLLSPSGALPTNQYSQLDSAPAARPVRDRPPTRTDVSTRPPNRVPAPRRPALLRGNPTG